MKLYKKLFLLLLCCILTCQVTLPTYDADYNTGIAPHNHHSDDVKG